MSDAQQPNVVTVNGKQWEIASLPQELIDLLSIHQAWSGDLQKQKREIFKTEAALRAITAEIEARFNQLDQPATN